MVVENNFLISDKRQDKYIEQYSPERMENLVGKVGVGDNKIWHCHYMPLYHAGKLNQTLFYGVALT